MYFTTNKQNHQMFLKTRLSQQTAFAKKKQQRENIVFANSS